MVGPAVTGFAVGDIVAVDLDYQQQTGYVGTGIAGSLYSESAAAGLSGGLHPANYV